MQPGELRGLAFVLALTALVWCVNSANALTQGAVTCATTATRIGTLGIAKVGLHIHNPTGGQSIFIGSSTVTSSGATKGLEIPSGTDEVLEDLTASEDVFCIVAATTQAITFLERSTYVRRVPTPTP